MYTVAVTPVLVGSAAAYYESGNMQALPLVKFLGAAVLIIGWLNLTNDGFDSATGIDRRKRESVVNLLGGTSRARIFLLLFAHFLLIIAFTLLRSLPASTQYLIAIATFAGYTYQGPPFRLGYLGLGEVICYFAWTIAVAAAHASQIVPSPSLRAAVEALVNRDSTLPAAAALVALPTALILLCSHFHQIADDSAAGKKSPVVRLGTARASALVRVLIALFIVLHPALTVARLLPALCGVVPALAAAPFAVSLARYARLHHADPERIRPLKYFAVKMHFCHGFALAASYAVAAWLRHGTTS